MTVYVVVDRINGREGHFRLGMRLQQLGLLQTAEYNPGGWADKEIFVVHPHIKFENEEDALAFVLAEGGSVSYTLPVKVRLGG